jgi:ubiquinone/menaquinone biosynthesis C-methylase UbiE
MKIDYTGISDTYDQYRSYPKSLITKVIELGRIKAGSAILDLGCGTGNAASRLLEIMSCKIIGVDMSSHMLKIAKEKSLQVIRTDIDKHRLPFMDNSFDMIITFYAIHQMSNLASLFSECNRILHDGELIILTSSHEQIEKVHPVIKQFFPSYVDIDKGRFPDIQRVDYLLDSAGFKDIKHEELCVNKIPIDNAFLQKVKAKYVSTYNLLPQKEFEHGIARLEEFVDTNSHSAIREWRATLISCRKKK